MPFWNPIVLSQTQASVAGLLPVSLCLASAAAAAQDTGRLEARAPAPMTAPPAASAEEIVVTATRGARDLRDVPAAISVQSLDTLRRDGFSFGTDEFRGVPGVSFRRGEGDGDEFPYVSIRGSPGTDGYLPLIDGIPFVGIFEEPFFSEFPYDALERIEVVRGPLSALYGRGALYGASNYLTRDPEEDQVRLAVTGGTDDFYRAEASVTRRLGGNFGVLIGGAYENSDGWRENSRREIWTLYGKARAELGADTTLTLFGTYIDRFTQQATGLPLAADGRVVAEVGRGARFLGFGHPFSDTTGAMASLRLEHRASDRLDLTFTAHHRRFDRDVFLNFHDPLGFDPARQVFGVNGFRNTSRHDVWFGETTASLDLGAHRILAGVGGEASTAREFNRWTGQFGFTPECGFTFFLIEIDYRTGQAVNRDDPCFVTDAPRTRSHFRNHFLGAFLQDEWRIGERLTLTLGGRYDVFRRRAVFDPLPASGPGGTQRLKANAFSPRAALSYRTGFGQVYAGYGRGFNANFGATFENDPVQYYRPRLEPTTIDSYEIGVKGRALDDALRVEAALFYSRQRNRRVIIPNPDAESDPTAPPNLITFGQIYDVRGLELSLNLRPRAGTSITLNFSHVDPEWKDFVLQTFDGPIDLSGTTPVGIARNSIYLAAEQRFARWLSARATFEWYDDYEITQDNSEEGGGYELLNLNARIAPPAWNGLSLDLTLSNALDRRYFSYFGGRENPTYATPGPPRQFRATLRATF